MNVEEEWASWTKNTVLFFMWCNPGIFELIGGGFWNEHGWVDLSEDADAWLDDFIGEHGPYVADETWQTLRNEVSS